MNVLVTFALDPEFAPWRALRAFRRVPGVAAARPTAPAIFESEIDDSVLRVALTGIGAAPAERAMETLLREPPDVCISSGLAGGLRPQHRPGQVLVARAVRQVMSCSGGFSPPSSPHNSDPALVEAAVRTGAKAVSSFLTTEQIVWTTDGKSALAPLADALEMEGYSILSRALAAGIPAIAIRAIGDPVETDMPLDFNRVVDERTGKLQPMRILRQVAGRPHRVPSFVRFGIESRRAASRLAAFLDRYVTDLIVGSQRTELVAEVAAG